MNSVSLFVALGTLFAGYLNIPVAEGSQARLLLESANNNTYKLNPDVLKEISQLQGPIQVIAVVGNARVGKSTTLNLISHIWKGEIEIPDVEEIFKTGDSFEAVTHDVWAHIIKRPQNVEGSILLLDVEGTDLGDDSVTLHLSMFTAMMSSGLNIFAKDVVANSDINFLYQISVLSETVIPDISLENFPKLRVVIRSDLKAPKDRNVQDFMRNFILEAKDQGKVIRKYFPRDNIEVSQIPFVKDPELFKDFEKLRKTTSYWSAIKDLSEQIKNTPDKKTFNGGLFDGKALAGLAETLKNAINSNSWHDFANPYQLLERDLCRRSKDELLQRASAMTARELETNTINIFVKFSERCRLDSETSLLKNVELPRMLKEKRKREEEDRKRKSEEDGWYKWAWDKGLPIYSGIITLAYFFSDERLKQDIVAVQFPSQYNHIGLQEVCWKWNEIAEKTFGLRGEGCGVIAQEVTKTYPWAVIKGKDGYLRVQYDILHEMIINNTRAKNDSVSAINECQTPTLDLLSQFSLRRTPSGPAPTRRLREVEEND